MLVSTLLQQFNMIVSYHSMDDDLMESMIKAFPKLTFVAAHPNEHYDYLKHIDRMKKYENAYLDISGLGLFRYGMLRYGIKKVGKDKFLFGSDYPICSPGMNVGGVLYEKLTDDEYEAVFWKNAERILIERLS